MSSFTDSTYIPDESEIQSSAGTDQWRLSCGVICRGEGRPNLASFTGEIRPRIVGRLKAIHEYPDLDQDKNHKRDSTGDLVYKWRVTIATSKGDEQIAVKTSSKAAISTFLYGLGQISPNELVQLSAKAGVAKTPGIEAPTYANWAKVTPEMRAVPIKEERSGGPFNAREHLAGLIEKMRTHGAYRGNPFSATGAGDGIPDESDVVPMTPWEQLVDDIRHKGHWPPYEIAGNDVYNGQAHAAYLTVAQKVAGAFKIPNGFTELSKAPERVIAALLKHHMTQDAPLPRDLEPLVELAKSSPASAADGADEYDPFQEI